MPPQSTDPFAPTSNPPFHRQKIPHLVWIAILVLVLGGMAFFSYRYLLPLTYADVSPVPSISAVEPAPVTEPLVVPVLAPVTAIVSADYYNRVRTGFVAEKKSFVDADLSTMTLRVYKEGAVALEVPIKTKGRDGSWWETPAGLYSIQAKQPNHFSSIGHVYQPWSMVFQGNFFIHGWPYEPDGTPVSSSYSGGCIRLTTDDAKAVYDLVTVGEPVLVSESDFTPDAFVYAKATPMLPTEIAASQYLVADLKNNVILAQQGIDEQMPIASVTKLVTSLVGAEYIDLDKTTTITQEMLVPTSKSRLVLGQKITVYNLLFPLLTESSNEAAEAIARTLGKKYFVSLMNAKAKAIDMQHTAFEDPSGAGDGNVSTATDLFSLLKYIYTNRSFVFNISSGKLTASVYGDSYYTDLQNFNLVPNTTAKFVGGKIGKTTAAEETYVGVFNEKIQGEVRPIAVIVLHSPDSYVDTAALLKQIEETNK
jgi:lipoprotein-anchoring transpeptidase ErfK/SrfK